MLSAIAPPKVGLETQIGSYAALGDSFTAGRGLDGRRWTDELASRLADRNPNFTHRNFARPGATSLDVVDTQLTRALEYSPDLVTIVCGVNDVLGAQRPDFIGYAERLSETILRLRENAVRTFVVTATCPNHAWRLSLAKRAHEQLVNGVELLNEATRSVARRLAVPYVDFGSARAAPDSEPGARMALSRDPRCACVAMVDAFATLVEDAPRGRGEVVLSGHVGHALATSRT